MEVNSKLYFIEDYGPKPILDEGQKLLDEIYGNFACSMVPKQEGGEEGGRCLLRCSRRTLL